MKRLDLKFMRDYIHRVIENLINEIYPNLEVEEGLTAKELTETIDLLLQNEYERVPNPILKEKIQNILKSKKYISTGANVLCLEIFKMITPQIKGL